MGRMVAVVELLQFTVLFAAGFWCTLFLMPLKAAHYAPNGRLVVRRIFLGNLLHALPMRRVRRSGANLVMMLGGEPAIVGGPAASASLVSILVAPWVS